MPNTSNLFVVSMGIGTVFIGLICIIILCFVVSALYRTFSKKHHQKPDATSMAQPFSPVANSSIPDRQRLIAAISAAVAEELGTDVSGIRIHSFKRI